MADKQETERSVWYWIEYALIFVFILNVAATFTVNFLDFAWSRNIMWAVNIAIKVFGMTGMSIAIWSLILVFIFIPFSLVSLALLFTSIIKPAWFKKTFRVKYWYGIFSIQIATWILILNL